MDRVFLFIGGILLSISYNIGRLGRWFRFKGIAASTYIKALDVLNNTFTGDSTMTDKAIASLKLRKGGCDVQTGSFRRVDCSGDEE